MPATYEPIATTTLGSAASSITFSSIPGTYTDLRLVFVVKATIADDLRLQFNTSTTTVYSITSLSGNGTSAASGNRTSQNYINPCNINQIPTAQFAFVTVDIFSYTGSTNKTVLCTSSTDINTSGQVENIVGLWRNTSAITSIDLSPASGNFTAGTTATLYGILKA